MKVFKPTKNIQLVSFSEISKEFTQPCDCGSPTQDLPKTRWWQGKYALSWPRSVLLCWKKSKPGAGDTGCLQEKVTLIMLLEPWFWFNHQKPALLGPGKCFFGRFLLRLSRSKHSQVMSKGKFGSTSIKQCCLGFVSFSCFFLGHPVCIFSCRTDLGHESS